jgi:predicted nucleotidyltransferase
MRRDEVLDRIAGAQPQLRRLHVRSLSLYGSVARDTSSTTSDIDIIVEFDDSPVTLFDFVALQQFLEQLLGRPVDLVERDAIRPELRDIILAEEVRAA